MQKESLDFLLSLLATPSPSGFEQPVQRLVKKRMQRFADSIELDVHGNLIACANPDGDVRVMLSGHCDQIGMMVQHIDDNGFITFSGIGGLDPTVIPGCRVTVHAKDGPINGVIGYKPVHLVPAEERGKKVELTKLWIDLGAKDGAEVRAVVRVGDPVTFALGGALIGKNAITSPGLDDKVGLFVCMEALRLFSEQLKPKQKHPVALYSVSSVQEEIGLRGAKTAAFGIDPVAGIAVDVTHASDNPGAEQKQIGVVKLGLGPTIARGPNINPVLEELLIDTATKKRINYQPLAAPGATGTDANVIQLSRSGVAAALIGLPNRYMHTQVEVCDLRDLEAAARLIAETVLRITKKTSFIPV